MDMLEAAPRTLPEENVPLARLARTSIAARRSHVAQGKKECLLTLCTSLPLRIPTLNFTMDTRMAKFASRPRLAPKAVP